MAITTTSLAKQDNKKTAQDWVRLLRFSSGVNKSTLGVDTDRVTPDLLLASSNKLLGISRGQQQGDQKDALLYQRIYGPVEYFALRIQKDGGSVARQMLWKATNKGNVDFIGSGSLQPHISAVFNLSNLSQFIDNTTPLLGIDASMKLTRLGLGGISSLDSAPILMRLVQPSYAGYVDPIRTALKSPGITAYMTKNVMKGTDGKLYQKLYNTRTGQLLLVDSQTAAKKIVTTNLFNNSKDNYVYAVGGPRGVRIVNKSDVDYVIPRSDDMFSQNATLVPMLSGIKAMRLLMGCHHPLTPVVVINSDGYTDIVPAKRLINYDSAYLFGCDYKGKDAIYKMDKIVTHIPDPTSKFKTVMLLSGRYLPTSPLHKWYIYNGKAFQKVYAKDLKPGMLVPRSMFTSMPCRLTKVMGVPVTELICVLLGRLIRSLTVIQYNYKFTFIEDKLSGVFQRNDIETALKQLGVKNCNIFKLRKEHAVSIKDPVFIDWINQNIGITPLTFRVPKEILSLPQGYTSVFLDSYYKDLTSVGLDNNGDNWLLDLPNDFMRDAISFMLSKIYTDTQFKDAYKYNKVKKALKLTTAKTSLGDVVLLKITKVLDSPAPAVMIDIDCGDNVYAAGNGIITHNSKYGNQAVPIEQREAPLVRSLDEATGNDMPTIIGKKLGTQWAPKPGYVKAVREDRIDMLYDDGTSGSVPLYKDFPANAKGWLTNYPKVKAGDRVLQGGLLATSNYTDDNGVLAMGRNLRIGYLSYHGGTYLDACTLSESAAKKMGYTTMYKTDMEKDKSVRTAKKLYNTWKPGQYSKLQMLNLDDAGVVKVGSTLNHGDPVILGIRTTLPSPGTLGKRILTDVTLTWLHANPGVVTDVVNTKSGIKVFAKVSSPLKLGDKISGWMGNKGTVAKVLPDDQMPHDSKGRPLLLLFDPLGIVSRTNPAQLMLAGLGKVALKTGKPIIMPSFSPAGLSRLEYTKRIMKLNNVPWKLDVTDPITGRNIKNVFVGKAYFLPLKHISDTKMSARGTDAYTAEEIPAGGGEAGSKRLGSLLVAALTGHNAFEFLQDAKLIRGQSNADFWRSIRTGLIPVMPRLPLVHKKFFATLQASGVNVQRNTKGVSVMSLTNKDVDLMAKGRLVTTTATYEQKNFRPIAGGLFDTSIFGLDGTNWGFIKLDHPLPNPVMLLPLARLLRISDQDFQAVIKGLKEVNGMKNADDMRTALSKLDLLKEALQALVLLKTATKSHKDAALKRYVAVGKMRDTGVRPELYMLDKIPVLPPAYRPISSHGGLTMIADPNYLYAQMINARDDAREAVNLPLLYQQEAQANIYSKWKLLVGLYDPSDVKLKNKNVKGLLKWALGKSPKWSAYQRKVLGSTVDTVGRGVVIPSTKIKLNLLGMPVLMAWDVYAPFVTRKLVQSNYSPVDAMKMVKNHDKRAMGALAEAMKLRPVVMNRAPSLHKLSLMGFNAKLTDGHAIKVNPSICPPYNMDFDGDSVWNLAKVSLTVLNAKEVFDKSQKYLLKTDGDYSCNSKNTDNNYNNGKSMISKETNVALVDVVCNLSEVPVKKETEVQKSETVTEWDTKDGVYVTTVDPATGKMVRAPMTKVSRHTGLEMYDCTLGISKCYEHVVTASKDHSLITLNPKTLELEKTTPEESVNRLVPVVMDDENNKSEYCAKYIQLHKQYPLSYKMGVFLGMMAGDGWIDGNLCTRIACNDKSLQQYILNFTAEDDPLMPFTKQAGLFSYKADEQRFSKDDSYRFTVYMDSADSEMLKKQIGTGADNKQLPTASLAGSKAHLIGILCGLLATDGHIGIGKAASKKATVKNIAYHTISLTLRDQIQHLCHKLGIKTRITPYMGANSKSMCYNIGFSLEDITKLKKQHPDLFVIPVDHKEAALQEICNVISKGVQNSFDIVPFPRGLFCEFSYINAVKIAKSTVIKGRSCGYIKRSDALKIADVMEKADWNNYHDLPNLALKDRTHHTPEEAKALVDKWINIVRDASIGWEVVESVTKSTCTEGWDCTVPGPYTFTLSTGTVVQDTVNLHVPVSQAAINNVRLNMMPLRNLISMRKNKILYGPEKAYTQGLYVATRMNSADEVKTFNTLKLAKEAYHKGIIDIDTPIVVKEK